MSNLKNKISPLHIFRRLVQIIFFIFLPGIFTSAFYAIKEVYVSLIGGTFTVSTNLGSILTILAVILVTIFLGRFFCGFLCSFGSMGDFLWFISKKTIKPKFRPSEQLDAGLKWIKYVLLLFIVIVFWTLNLITLDSTVSPWTIFGMYASLGGWPSAKYLISIGGLLLLLIMIGSLFIERFFCRYLCPLGAIFAVVSKIRLFKINKNREHCGSCRLCTKNCAMGIPLYQYDKINSGECINCFACVEGCPRKNVKTNPAPAVASAASVAAITGLVYAGNIASASTAGASDSTNSVVTESAAIGNYTDGTYTGTGDGFRGETKVSVTVENGNITDITVVSYEDDKEYFERAESTIISEILEAQNTDVDAVSGATFSSNGIIAAVADALGVSDSGSSSNTTSSETNQSQENDISTNDTSSDSAAIGMYTDGTYTGIGTGFRGDTEVSVTVENGNITDITVVSYEDDKEYFEYAENTIISEILEAQNTDVDAVSGATFSSNGIIAAVADALGISDSGSSGDTAESETNQSQASDTDTNDISSDSSDQTYTDGTYTGTGSGFRGETEVSVTVENGKIADITVVSYKDDEQYFSRAESTVISEIIEAQDVDVDAVSGATFSSNGLMEAVANALGVSYINENSTLHSEHGRGKH